MSAVAVADQHHVLEVEGFEQRAQLVGAGGAQVVEGPRLRRFMIEAIPTAAVPSSSTTPSRSGEQGRPGSAGLTVCPTRVAAPLPLDENDILVCGIALGHGDNEAPENWLQSERQNVEAFASFHGFRETPREAC